MDLEHDIDAVLVELDDLGFDPRCKPALAAIKLEDPVHVGARRGPGEDLPRSFLDLRRDLVVFEALVALKDDAVDDRVFADIDDEIAGFGARDCHVGEELRCVKILERLIERRGGVDLARRKVGIGSDRRRLETLVAAEP